VALSWVKNIFLLIRIKAKEPFNSIKQGHNSMDVSIIIINYNTKNLTLKCLESVFRETVGLEIEVILVDNHSTDGSQKAIKDCFPEVILLENSENIGFGRANNAGCHLAKGKYLFLLNSDTKLLNNAIKYFYDFAEQQERETLGCLGGILMDEMQKTTHSSGPFPKQREILWRTIFGYITNSYWKKLHRREISVYKTMGQVLNVDYVTGADLFVPTALFHAYHGFDPGFFMYYEETDLQKRMHQDGYRNRIIKGPEIIHLLEGSAAKNNNMAKRIIQTDSMFFYFKKYSSNFSYGLFRGLYFFIRMPLIVDRRVPLKDRAKYLWSLIHQTKKA
jgi:GT2 family glycosyltransferase